MNNESKQKVLKSNIFREVESTLIHYLETFFLVSKF